MKIQSNKRILAKKVAGLVSALIFIGLIILLTWFFVGFFRRFSDPNQFKEYINSFGGYGKAVFLGLQILQVVVAFIPGEVVEIGAGYAYGALEGTLLCLAGVAIASSIIFALTKFLGLRLVELFVSREKINSLRFINSEKKLRTTIFILFFIPGTPKDVLTYFAGLTRVKMHEFLPLSLIARIPSIVTSTWGGSAVAEKDYTKAIIIFAVTAAVSLIGLQIYSFIMKKMKQRHERKEAAKTQIKKVV